jgi:formylglycine-generating enzyme required for sulfatase activity/serine/threonine protein kinase
VRPPPPSPEPEFLVLTCEKCAAVNPLVARNCHHCGEALPPAPKTLQVGRYRLAKHLKTGGFGAIYLARDTSAPDQVVVVKEMIVPDPAEFQTRLNFFLREAEILRLLNEKRLTTIPRFHELFQDEQQRTAHLVMELIPGQNLLEVLEGNNNRPFPFDLVVEWGKTLCDVLAAMHDQDPPLVHRDVKPDNVMLLPDGRSIKVIDFGTARDVRDPAAKTRVFSQDYAAPEQVGGHPEPRSDLFALAATLFHLATGRTPRGAQTADDVAQLLKDPSSALPRWFLELLAANLAAPVNSRHPSARAFKEDLELQRMRRRTGLAKCRLEGTSLRVEARTQLGADGASLESHLPLGGAARASTSSLAVANGSDQGKQHPPAQGTPAPASAPVPAPAPPPAPDPDLVWGDPTPPPAVVPPPAPTAPSPAPIVWGDPTPAPAAPSPAPMIWGAPAPTSADVWADSSRKGGRRGIIILLLLLLLAGAGVLGYRKGLLPDPSTWLPSPPTPQAVVPTVNAPTATDITPTEARLGGTVASDGGAPITRRGILCSRTDENPNPTRGGTGVREDVDPSATTGAFALRVTGLRPGTRWSFVAYAENSAGISYTPAQTITTRAILPTVEVPTATDVTETSALLAANVTSDGGSPITVRGILCSRTDENPNPRLGARGIRFTFRDPAGPGAGGRHPVRGMKPGTRWSFVAFAANGIGVAYSSTGEFTTTPEKNPSTLKSRTTGLDLVRIQKGTFLMGSPTSEACRDRDEHQHFVHITKPFYLGKYPVTVGQFRAFVDDMGYRTEAEAGGGGAGIIGKGKNPFAFRPAFSWRNPGYPQSDWHPVVNVTWNDARKFCAWLSRKDGRTYRLPTEAEWEYACRAGTATRFYCGDTQANLKYVANIADEAFKAQFPQMKTYSHKWNDGYAFAAPVDASPFLPNRFGLYGMHGNVWQWCADHYARDYYEHSPERDPPGPPSGPNHVLRGGSWINDSKMCRCAQRANNLPDTCYNDLGFRVACDTVPGPP